MPTLYLCNILKNIDYLFVSFCNAGNFGASRHGLPSALDHWRVPWTARRSARRVISNAPITKMRSRHSVVPAEIAPLARVPRGYTFLLVAGSILLQVEGSGRWYAPGSDCPREQPVMAHNQRPEGIVCHRVGREYATSPAFL